MQPMHSSLANLKKRVFPSQEEASAKNWFPLDLNNPYYIFFHHLQSFSVVYKMMTTEYVISNCCAQKPIYPKYSCIRLSNNNCVSSNAFWTTTFDLLHIIANIPKYLQLVFNPSSTPSSKKRTAWLSASKLASPYCPFYLLICCL